MLDWNLHVNDRQKGTINKFHAVGISVSYDFVMEFARAVSKAMELLFQPTGGQSS